ncbi:helix-turn-helix domain-containing protein [Clostridium estertheticum]|uniref:helix-turn-helix domain-containing protein n=1 Tax=Clostridium estertheticum TaxID=238834 RepID=UPI001C7D3EDA|nr:helix-turn-helix transcriptional regulator [Clostridium estertheticum]MBX4267993.1 helix-turn-helix domain-containing protein [Clostridium estertheticum]WLC80065.1 helix-turn-helix domain-containing protein [Clostridium estertheticum]
MVLSKKEVGLLINKARKHKSKIIGGKYTQSMLAMDLELSRGYIGDIENGRIYPNYVLLNKIAEKCEVPLGFFVDEEKSDIDIDITKTEDKEIIKRSLADKSTSDFAEITDVKEAMDIILSQSGLMLNGEMLSKESKIALANAIQMGIAYAEKMQNEENK